MENCEKQSKEIISMNKHLTSEIIKCEEHVQNCNQFLDNLLYTNEPVTKEGIVCYLLYLLYILINIIIIFLNLRCGWNHVTIQI